MDFAAFGYRENPPKSVISNIHHGNGVGDPFTLLYEIPVIVLVLDIMFGMILSFLFIFVSLYCIGKKNYNDCCNPFLWLCLSTLGFVFCIITHLPFIAIAYLNDAYHAGSIFIYYTIITLILFAVVEQMIVSCLSKLKSSEEIQLQDSKWYFQSGTLHILAPDVNQQEYQIESGTNSKLKAMELSLDTNEEKDNHINISQGKVGVHFRSVDSKIVLQIKEGTFKFKGCKPEMEEPKQKSEDSAAKGTNTEAVDKHNSANNKNDSQEKTSIPSEQELLITFLKHCQSQQEASLVLRDHNVLPTAHVEIKCKSNGEKGTKWLTFSGLKPVKGQELKLGNINPEEKTVQITKTELTLQKAGKFCKICCRTRTCCTTFCCTMFGSNYLMNDLWSGCFVLILGLLVLFIIGIVAVLTCYFVIIPINRSISDAPNRLIGIYESAIVLIGAYIAYKAFFKAKKYLENSVVKRENPLTDPLSKESKDKWKAMSDEEKLAEFYSAVVDIIVHKKSKCQEPEEAKQDGGTGAHNGGEQPSSQNGTGLSGDTTSGRSGEQSSVNNLEDGSQTVLAPPIASTSRTTAPAPPSTST